MRVLGWIELRFRVLAVLPRRDPARIWLRWAREAHHSDVALACLDRSMALGDADALFEHALLEAEGLFGAAEPAIRLRQAAEQGHVEAMTRLADCLRRGPGKERDAEQARRWLTRAAEADFRPAAESLAAWMEDSGETEGAAAWRERTAAMAPRTLRAGLLKPMESRDPLVRAEAAAMRAMDEGFTALLQQSWAPPIFMLLVIALALGFAVALVIGSVLTLGLPLFVIGAYYLLFGRRRQHAWRFRRLVDAAEAGDAEAAFRLGSDYLKGMPGLAPDALSAAVWFRRAAEGGHRGAMAALGEALRSGHGIRRDAKEADAWIRAARA